MYRQILRKRRTKRPRLGYLVDVEYDGKSNRAVLIFLDPRSQELFRWYDKTGHVSYLLTDAPTGDVEEILGGEKDYIGVTEVKKYNAILDKEVTLRKVMARNPLAIGGEVGRTRRDNYRNILERAGYHVWEAWIHYVNNYCYDLQFEIGMPYLVSRERVVPYRRRDVEERIRTVLGRITKNTRLTSALAHWVRILEQPLPPIKVAAIDIEVLPKSSETMPNALIADQPVICVSFVCSDGRRIVVLLRRKGVPMGRGGIPASIIFAETEDELILTVFRLMKEYPFITTFNGDNFDLMYLYNRAKKLGIPMKINPIYISKKQCKLKTGIHIDLYPFFKNRSIQNYAFKGKYKDFSLDDIASALLDEEKIKLKKSIEWLDYVTLANYCLKDSELTYKLLTFNNGITINLILSLARMANLTIHQLTRHAISDWVRSTFYYLCRMRNWLIPNKEELDSKGTIQTTAKIKGKKYEGAIVRDPRSGIFFNVIVMDFASLYPSEVKERNIGFATINCPHPECQDNKVPFTTHHICKKRRAIEADVIGGLRDARVYFYKPESKNKENPLSPFYAVLEQAIKVYINASYGVFGSTKFALYCPPVAEAVTAYSRRDMQAVANKAIEIGADPFYGDTDSIFLNNPTKQQTALLQSWASRELKLDLGIDKVYRYAIFSKRKKNYLGVYKDGRVDIKGLTGKKRHTPDIIKKAFYRVTEILGSVMNMQDYENARKEVWKVAVETYRKIKDKKWDSLDELAFHMRLTMSLDQYKVNSQHVKAARMLRESGHRVGMGDVIHFIKATNKEGVMPLAEADPELVNVDAYVDALRSVFVQILEPMDIDFDGEIMGRTNLDMFMGDKKVFLVDFLKGSEEK